MPLACYNLSIPFCGSMKFIENPDHLESFQFVMAAGNVPFYASDLRNTEGWLRKVSGGGLVQAKTACCWLCCRNDA
jgi:hypothetical protein